MLRRLKIQGFKSLQGVELKLPQLTVLFGPNAAGKSNVLDAIQALSRAGTERTLSDALSEPIRGYPIEAFAFPGGGLASLLNQKEADFTLEADLGRGTDRFRYRIRVAIQPSSGGLSVMDEYLTALNAKGEPKGSPSIQKVSDKIHIRRKGKAARPRQEPVGLNHSMLSDPRLGGLEYRQIEKCRADLTGWRVYYLDPRVAMRAAKPPAEATDIGVAGENIAPFLYRLQAERPKHFEAIKRTMRSIVPSVESVEVDLDKRRGTLDVLIRQDGTVFSSRIVSEGTLRVLALCSIAVNPWGGTLIAFEEPENGVHPRRVELIARLLLSLATEQDRQVIVTTHSPLFCDAVRREDKSRAEKIAMFNVHRSNGKTVAQRFELAGPLYADPEITKGLTAQSEDGLFEGLLMRGLIDE